MDEKPAAVAASPRVRQGRATRKRGGGGLVGFADPATALGAASAHALLAKLDALRTELVDLAHDLDVRGARSAADVAMTTSARLAELCEEFSPHSATPISGPIPTPCPN